MTLPALKSEDSSFIDHRTPKAETLTASYTISRSVYASRRRSGEPHPTNTQRLFCQRQSLVLALAASEYAFHGFIRPKTLRRNPIPGHQRTTGVTYKARLTTSSHTPGRFHPRTKDPGFSSLLIPKVYLITMVLIHSFGNRSVPSPGPGEGQGEVDARPGKPFFDPLPPSGYSPCTQGEPRL